MERFPGRIWLTAMLTFGVLVYCLTAHWPKGSVVAGRINVADAQYRMLLHGRSDRLSASGDRPLSPGTEQHDPIPRCRGAEVEFQWSCASWWGAQGRD